MNKTPDTNKTSCQHPDAALTTVIYFVDEDRLLSLTHEHPRAETISLCTAESPPRTESPRTAAYRRGAGGEEADSRPS